MLGSRIRDVPDYPKPGIVFKDITPLLADPAAFRVMTGEFARQARESGATKVVGLEARGFILAAPVAVAAQIGFIPVRKAGKLPGAVHAVSYALEYGEATLEIHRDSFVPGDRVLIVDDVLATGGTAAAAVEAIRRCGAEPVGLSVLMELGFLGGRGRLALDSPSLPVTALLTV
ncbi:adenine phosphoribosyltransferase [Actinocrinis puniceicyclus]|uniref:Adenine phosphoribosyltransferase n=1 Tax=Actinocrinis puniceicyclus TaxID=977794 RepID=A0A8J7WM14_9ACTN|nr:adenine phosphoribosyltransferase [Actinocrinis puniceicyclus]